MPQFVSLPVLPIISVFDRRRDPVQKLGKDLREDLLVLGILVVKIPRRPVRVSALSRVLEDADTVVDQREISLAHCGALSRLVVP